ncbi:RimK family alpha-L-glutamate ligase [Candidatus Marinimicrobia bacterium MT.SAG.2]|nr:RimK family alpha-L-glutamate ligase [Candidatus Marinimicrobia bacterium MT.SAG.2]
MRLGILSKGSRIYSTKRIREAARNRGHRVITLNPLKCQLNLMRYQHSIYYSGRKVNPPDVIIPRIGATLTNYGISVVRQFEILGSKVLNSADSISRSRDKMRALQLLAAEGIHIPKTVMARNPNQLVRALQLTGGPPTILKLIEGTQGIGVILSETRQSFESTLDTLWNLGQDILIQQFMAESKGRDIRAFVINGKVVAAMKREAAAEEFRANIHRGGTGKMVTLSSIQEETAIRATEIIGLGIAGVDFFDIPGEPIIIELNSSPGLQGIERASGVDVATEIIKYAEFALENN